MSRGPLLVDGSPPLHDHVTPHPHTYSVATPDPHTPATPPTPEHKMNATEKSAEDAAKLVPDATAGGGVAYTNSHAQRTSPPARLNFRMCSYTLGTLVHLALVHLSAQTEPQLSWISPNVSHKSAHVKPERNWSCPASLRREQSGLHLSTVHLNLRRFCHC